MNTVHRFDLQPKLAGDTISLRPLRKQDMDLLYVVAADPLIWEQHPEPLRYQRPVFEKFFSAALASGGALAVIDQRSGSIIGTSRYYDWDAARAEIAIGYSFLSRNYWGGSTNHEMKQLMLNHAFRCAKIVWFHVGPNNWRSRKAMEKIGGVLSHEGTKTLDGKIQSFVFFKIEAPRSLPVAGD